MIIDCISDLHGNFPQLEGGDLLIVAGDLTARDENDGYTAFELWLVEQKYNKKIIVAGNHDNQLERKEWMLGLQSTSEYLCDSGTEFEGIKIWGSPWSLSFPGINPHCMAFTGSEKELEAKFKLIPDDTDILITHSPPYGFLDRLNRNGKKAGSLSLKKEMRRIKPFLHVFGHIHEGYGQTKSWYEKYDLDYATFVNASHVNADYEPVNKPIRIEL